MRVTAPALQRTASQELRAALRPGHGSPQTVVHDIVIVYLSRCLPPALYFARPVHEGALLEAILRWGRARAGRRGNPKVDAAPEAVLRKHGLGRPWVSVRPLNGSATVSWLDAGQASGAKTPCSRTSTGVCQVPGRTDQGFKTPRRDAERRRRVPLFLGDPGNKPRPLPRCAFRRSVSPQKGEIN